GVPSRESGDVEHHQPAMTAPSQRICRTLSTLPSQGTGSEELTDASLAGLHTEMVGVTISHRYGT
ncbi:hypothetical protein, partial [Mesorhizobium sp.]|uniref:hypothetical protein n=1 Tax=Mesorhizobium sp. TaxID=1871066 RepID=UPI00257AD8AF